MGQRQSQEEIDRQKEKLSFQYKISGIYNKSLGGEAEMTVDSLVNIFGNKPLFNEGLCLLLCPLQILIWPSVCLEFWVYKIKNDFRNEVLHE